MTLNKTSITVTRKLKAVEMYLRSGQSLRKIAADLGIPCATLWFWVKQYREGGKDNLNIKDVRKRKVSKSVELQVMKLKEQNPSLSVRRARVVLRNQGISLSKNGIWQIWRRYGIAKRSVHEPLSPFGISTPESDKGLQRVKAFVREGDLKAAAHVLNALPHLPEDRVIMQIPKKYLSPRRRLDRLWLEFAFIPFPQFKRNARRVGKMLENRGFIYSSIIANFLELYALQHMGKVREQILVFDLLAKKMHHVRESTLWFDFYTLQAIAYADMLDIGKANYYLKQCRRILYRLPYPHYWDTYSALLTGFGKFKEAHAFSKRALRNVDNELKVARLNLRIAHLGPVMSGQYSGAKKMLSRAVKVKNKVGLSAFYLAVQAYIAFGQGNLADASQLFLAALEKSYKGELHNRIYATSAGLAAVAMALNRKTEARMHLKKYLPLMKKHRLMKEALFLKSLLKPEEPISEDLLTMPYLRVLFLIARAQRTMKITDYRRAFNFASRQKILGHFHRLIVFFPAPIIHILEKGKQTGLPRALLQFPIFNQTVPVYHMKFLGDVVITKNQHYMRTQLGPKEKAFLIHLALRAGAPGKSILLNDLRKNFWTHVRNPAGRLSHLLSGLKKKLRVPGHFITVSSRYGEARLNNRGIYITTDFDEFQTLLTQAKSLDRAGEWHVAKRDYMRAFTLLRGAPFEKMYDNWSESMRSAILNKTEAEAIRFTKGCLEHNNIQEARVILDKVVTIIPHSQEVKKLLKQTRS